MAFSGLMGFIGGASHAAGQVMDANIARMDAAGVAREKEAAQMRLEALTNQYKIDAVDKENVQEGMRHNRGLMDDKNKIAAALQATKDATAYNQDPVNITKANVAANSTLAGNDAAQADLVNKKANSDAVTINANAHMITAKSGETHLKNEDARKAREDKAGKKLTEPEIAARVHAGVGTIDYVFGKGLDIAGRALNPNAIDDDQLYMATKAEYEDAVRKGELPLSASSRLVLKAIGGDKAKKKALEDYEAQQKSINDNKHWWKPDEKPATPNAPKTITPKAEYDKLPSGSRYTGPDGKTYIKGK